MNKEIKAGHQGVRWPTTIWMIVFHLGAVAALFYWSWRGLIVAAVLAWVAQSLGVGMTYHRLLTHRSYKVPKPVEYFLIICATISFEGGPINWVATHRIHHAHSDERGDDPHTPNDGRWWSHMGWILSGTAQQHSGSIRYYASRPTLRWDLLSPTRLDQVLATFRAQGYEPVLVVDGGEYEQFREKFDATGQRAVRQLTLLAVMGDARVFGFR